MYIYLYTYICIYLHVRVRKSWIEKVKSARIKRIKQVREIERHKRDADTWWYIVAVGARFSIQKEKTHISVMRNLNIYIKGE